MVSILGGWLRNNVIEAGKSLRTAVSFCLGRWVRTMIWILFKNCLSCGQSWSACAWMEGGGHIPTRPGLVWSLRFNYSCVKEDIDPQK